MGFVPNCQENHADSHSEEHRAVSQAHGGEQYARDNSHKGLAVLYLRLNAGGWKGSDATTPNLNELRTAIQVEISSASAIIGKS